MSRATFFSLTTCASHRISSASESQCVTKKSSTGQTHGRKSRGLKISHGVAFVSSVGVPLTNVYGLSGIRFLTVKYLDVSTDSSAGLRAGHLDGYSG